MIAAVDPRKSNDQHGGGVGDEVSAILRARRRTRLSVQPVTLLIPEVEAQQMKAKRGIERGRPLNQVLLVEDLDRAGVTSMSVGLGPHEPLDAVLRQVATGELGTDEQAQGFVVHGGLSGDGKRRSQIHRSLDAPGRQPEKARVQARLDYTCYATDVRRRSSQMEKQLTWK
jgi:hypothetical protein